MDYGKESGGWVGELSWWRPLHAGWRQTPAECGRHKDKAKYSTDKVSWFLPQKLVTLNRNPWLRNKVKYT